MTIEQLRASHLVIGPGGPDGWDAEWRAKLVSNLAILVNHLFCVGVNEIYVDGSFTEDKPHPNDIDGYYVCDKADIASNTLFDKLSKLPEGDCWILDPTGLKRNPKGLPKMPMWHEYSVELFPHFGQLSGIPNEHGHPQTFPAAFRMQRNTWKPKGIIKIAKPGETDP